MRKFDFPLGPADLMTIRRVIKPPRVPNKGKAVYRINTTEWPLLEENGWEFVSRNRKDRLVFYCRSPNGEIAETFKIHILIPTDEAVLKLFHEFRRAPSIALGPREGFEYEARMGPYLWAMFYPHGNGHYYYWEDPAIAPTGTIWKMDMPPSMSVHGGEWSTHLFWPYGFDVQPIWQRHQYFSGLVPHLDYKGLPISEERIKEIEADSRR